MNKLAFYFIMSFIILFSYALIMYIVVLLYSGKKKQEKNLPQNNTANAPAQNSSNTTITNSANSNLDNQTDSNIDIPKPPATLSRNNEESDSFRFVFEKELKEKVMPETELRKIYNQLKDFIESDRKMNVPDPEIKKNLLDAGWEKHIVERMFKSM